VEEWNEEIAKLNPEVERSKLSQCWFSEVDDVHGHLKTMMTKEAMLGFDREGIPPHELKLKVIKMEFSNVAYCSNNYYNGVYRSMIFAWSCGI
jgi:hypothetical protein